MKYRQVIPILFTVFLDIVGLGLVIPIMSPAMLSVHSTIVPPDMSYAVRTQILGFFIAAYPLAQFFGAPILGGYSDKFGRKKVLMWSLVGTFFSYLIIGYGMMHQNLVLIFAGRILDGFTGGNISIAYSAIADLSNNEDKARNFGMVGMVFGLGFVLGPFIGAQLTNPSLVSWFNIITPFWISAGLTLINILLVAILFKETLTEFITSKVNMLTGVKNIALAFTLANLRSIFLTNFFFVLGFNFFAQFFQVYLVKKFNFNEEGIGNSYAYFGLFAAITQGLILRFAVKKASAKKILYIALLVEALIIPVLVWPDKLEYLYWIAPIIAVFYGLINPNMTSVISNLASKDSQGEILGVNQSIVSMAQSIPPILSGYLVIIDVSLPTKIAGALIFIAWLLYVFLFLRKKEHKFDIP